MLNNKFMDCIVSFYTTKIPVSGEIKYYLSFNHNNLDRFDIKSLILLGYFGKIDENITADKCEIIAMDTINNHERVWLQALIETTNATILIIDRTAQRKTIKLNINLPVFSDDNKDEYIDKFINALTDAFNNKIVLEK